MSPHYPGFTWSGTHPSKIKSSTFVTGSYLVLKALQQDESRVFLCDLGRRYGLEFVCMIDIMLSKRR